MQICFKYIKSSFKITLKKKKESKQLKVALWLE